MEKSNSNKELYKRLIIRLILCLIYAGIILMVLPKIFKLFHPFIFALIMATILNPIVNKIHKLVSKLDQQSLKVRKIITLILNILMLLIVFSLIFYLSYIIIKEVISFSLSIQQNWSSILIKFDSFQERFDWLIKILPPQFIELLDSFKGNILELIKNTSKQLLSFSISATATIITGAGNFFVNFVTFFLAMYFLISDYHIIGNLERKYSNKSFFKTINILKVSIINALDSFFKAQFILAMVAFIFMFISLSIYGQSHAFIISLFLGFLDFLPIVGTIALLLPWGIIEYIGGDMKKGIYLIIIGIIFLLIRRIIEPKIVGSQTGLHPLLALMSTYVGLRFSGVWGAILGPLLLMLVISVVKSGIFENTIADLKQVYNKISVTLGSK